MYDEETKSYSLVKIENGYQISWCWYVKGRYVSRTYAFPSIQEAIDYLREVAFVEENKEEVDSK